MELSKSRVLITILLCMPLYSIGQKSTVSLKTGYGYYQGFHIGANYFYAENIDLGVSIGSHFGLSPLNNEDHINITLENNFHFGEKNKFYTKPWIFGQQIMYWTHCSETITYKIATISPTIGRVIAITNRLGIELEIGPTFNLEIDIEREPTDPITSTLQPVYYNYIAQLIYIF
ncbi:MAG: hypothetical protein U9R60_01355 [Bacteroidota bacterium]|nr:hypothetical protein [Bacteroidota bacterium]